jgi:hypothetical protein
MIIKTKIRKIGNSLGVIIPKEVISKIEDDWKIGKLEHLCLDVITDWDKFAKYIDEPDGVLSEPSGELQTDYDVSKYLNEKVENKNKLETLREKIKQIEDPQIIPDKQ